MEKNNLHYDGKTVMNGVMTTPGCTPPQSKRKDVRNMQLSSPGRPVLATDADSCSPIQQTNQSTDTPYSGAGEVQSSKPLEITKRDNPSYLNEGAIDKTQALVAALNSLLSESSNASAVSLQNAGKTVLSEQKPAAEEHKNASAVEDNEGYASILKESVKSNSRGKPTVSKAECVQQIQVPLYLTAPNRKTGIINSTPLLFNSSTTSQAPRPPSRESLSPTLGKPVNKVDPIPNSENSVKMPAATLLPPYAASSDPCLCSDVTIGCTQGLSFSDVDRLSQERDALQTQLEVQLKVNTDLKKLLVASVGEDLENRVEYLARDRAQLALEVGDYSKRLHKDFEDLDRLSIQADMWRSKCIGSRVMIDELTGMKSQLAMKFHECQHALQEMLQERHEVRANLQHITSCLADLRDAFDPKHAGKYPHEDVGSVIDLARASRQLANAVRFRLLGSSRHRTESLNVDPDGEDNLTAAEYHASQILSDEGIVQENIHKEIPRKQYMERYERFHPLTRYERLTINCCAKCHGEIKLV